MRRETIEWIQSMHEYRERVCASKETATEALLRAGILEIIDDKEEIAQIYKSLFEEIKGDI